MGKFAKRPKSPNFLFHTTSIFVKGLGCSGEGARRRLRRTSRRNLRTLRPIKISASTPGSFPGGAPVRRSSGQVGDVQRYHPLVSQIRFSYLCFSPSLCLSAVHSSFTFTITSASSCNVITSTDSTTSSALLKHYHSAAETQRFTKSPRQVGVGARNEGSPPPRGVPWATPWLKVRAAERLPTGHITTGKKMPV
ncbi:hypothetical protein CEXT_180821 [Caerostris extrusa]|uniref:Uncharacterized protein n=1 Tax=Caerostris extrusa TaxID=172846 RepID=A0AAV4MDT4_CAEEX|nr:hypothetical protein CEXT_180821 [Caerostris extrusa]